MPIYAYRCTACGHAQDVLQKISDDVLTVCPACGAASFAKQVTAAGFQLKGSGSPAADDAGKGAAPAADKAPAAAPSKAAEVAKPAAAAAPAPAAPKTGA